MFHGPLIKIKKVFHKDIRIFRPVSPFFPFWKRPEVEREKKKKRPPNTGPHGKVRTGTWGKICKHFFTWLNAGSCLFPLLFHPLEVLSSNMAPPGWGNRDTASVCVRVGVCVIADLPLWNKTGSYIVHKIPLQNLAKAGGSGMDPFELSVLLLLLPSVALNPRGSNCGYRTLYSYEHNTLQVTQGTFMTNLHLFHKSVIKGRVDILMLICIFFL